MIQALIGLLVCGLAVHAVRYSDYEGARMPQYSIEEADREGGPLTNEYVDRSPDAPAPLDYKYEEESRGKMHKLPVGTEEDVWHKPNKNIKELPNLANYDDDIAKHEAASVPKSKAGRKNRKHRNHIKNQEFDRESDKRVTKYVRNRKLDKDDVNSRNDYIVKSRAQEDNSIDSDSFEFRDTTQKIIRRKPRDRSINRRRPHIQDMEDDNDDEDEEDVKHLRRTDEQEYRDDRGGERRRFMIDNRPSPIPESDKIKPKNHRVYDDYYDMKRVNDIKSKLPSLFRKTQASTTETPSTRYFQDITHRRANPPENTGETTTETTSTKKVTTTSAIRTNDIPLSISSTDLSLAEKSRLSILKKSQRKDHVRNVTWTTKPPVLIQVTKGMHTLVMVEPQQRNVRLQAREVFDDSPERIAQAKKLMRRKLIAGARSIHDLTDNWDEMICDYVDVSLLNNGCYLNYPALELLVLCAIISLMYIYASYVSVDSYCFNFL